MRNLPAGRFVVLDFETTGISPFQGARVIEVSAREIVDGVEGREFQTLVDPGVRVPTEITSITGITTDMLRGAPTSSTVMPELASFIGSSPIVCHNAGFDRKFLEFEARDFLGGQTVATVCTLLLARRLFPGRSSYRLGRIIEGLGIVAHARLHRASADTYVTSLLFDRICADARLHCASMSFEHDVLYRLQRVRIASAFEWLQSLGTASATGSAAATTMRAAA